MDKIIVKGLKIFAYHGVNEEEKINGQNFILDIDSYLSLAVPCESDNVEDTVSYTKIIKTATAIFVSQKDDLIERAAQRVAVGLLESFERIDSVRVLLKKPDAPIKADFEYAGVEIYRERKDVIK